MDAIFDAILSQAGLAGAFIVVLLLVAWKLYRDVIKAKDDVSKAKDAAFEALRAAKEKQEAKYQKAIEDMAKSMNGIERLTDRLVDSLTRR